MSYLVRLKRKISEDTPECRATKGTKAPFDTFVALHSAPTREIFQHPEIIQEASEERAAILEFDGCLPRTKAEAVAELFKAFYGHLMGVGKRDCCCYAPVNRYCSEGRRLRDIYYGACS